MKPILPFTDATIAPSDSSRHARVLVVEDDARLRDLSRRFLERQNWQVMSAGDAAEAMRLVIEKRDIPDVMITDVVLPDLSGPELVIRIRASFPSIRILYISGYAPSKGEPEGSPEEVAYLQKPFSFETLIREVEQLLKGRSPDPADVSE